MNNKGFLRILEAVIAIIIIFMFTYYITPKDTEKIDVEGEKIKLLQKTILNEISYNENFRDCILNNNQGGWDNCKSNIITYAEDLDKRYQGKISIVKCDIDDINCKPCEVSSNNVYVSDVLITDMNNKQRVTICIGK